MRDMKNFRLIFPGKILICVFLSLASAFFPAFRNQVLARDGDPAETALVFELKPSFQAAAERITLGDICDIKPAPGFKADTGRIASISMGFAPARFVERRVHKFEVDNILRQKLSMPAGSRYEIAGAAFCAVTASAEGGTDPRKLAGLKAALEEKIGALFAERYRDEFELGETDRIVAKIGFGLDRAALGRIAGRGEVKIDIASYKASAALVEVRYETELLAKLRVRITRRTEAAAAGEALLKNTAVDLAKIKTREIEIFAEKYNELFLTRGGGAENNAELARAERDGLEFARNVAPGEAIKKGFLKKKLLVRAGQRIILYVERGGSAMSFNATASRDGGAGDTIEAVNPRTRRKYRAVVTGEGEAEAIE